MKYMPSYKQSFSSHPKAKLWSVTKNKVDPRSVFKTSSIKYWFDCPECNHTFESSPSNIDKGCPYCLGKTLCDKDCKECFKQSFSSHPKAKPWSNKVYTIAGTTQYRYWSTCVKCKHVFETSIYSVVCGENWCSVCSFKAKDMLCAYLQQNYDVIQTYKAHWRPICCSISYDFYLPDKGIFIELDDMLYSEYTGGQISIEEKFTADSNKIKEANKYSISVIKILQDVILHNKYNWMKHISNSIDDIYTTDTIKNVFIEGEHTSNYELMHQLF